LRPLGVAGADDTGSELGADLKVSFHIEHLQTGQEALHVLLSARGCQQQGGNRTVAPNQAGGHLVPGLCDPAPGRSGEPIL